jgi:hypothetical protein
VAAVVLDWSPRPRPPCVPVRLGVAIQLINWPFLHDLKGSPAEYKAGLELAIARGWLTLHESGTYVKFTQEGANLFA